MINIPTDIKWKENALTIAGGNGEGDDLNYLNLPWSIAIDSQKTIYIVDRWNHRVVAWKTGSTYGQIVAGGNGEGNEMNQLNYPTKVIIDEINDCLIIADCGNKRIVRWPRHNGQSGQTTLDNVACFDLVMHKNEYFYTCDHENHEVRRWKIGENEGGGGGVVVAGGNGCGNQLNQFNQPQTICIDEDETIYISDCLNHRVMKWRKCAKEGIIVVGGQGEGNSLKQLWYPSRIIVDQLGSIYVAEAGNHRIVRWLRDAKEGTIIAGGNNAGNQSNQFNYPADLLIDNDNDLYVADCFNHRIQKFLRY